MAISDDEEQRMRAILESERMAILASQYRQMGFLELAKFVSRNSKAAFKWATRLVPH